MAATELEFTPPAGIAQSAAWVRLSELHRYYSANAGSAQQTYRRIKLLLIVISAAIPLLAFAPLPGETPKFVVGLAGVAIAVLEGVLLLNRYGEKGVTYRRTSEGLKRERALLLAGAGDYRGLGPDDALRLLSERTEALVAEENRQWAETQLKTLEALAKTRAFAREQAAPGA